MGDLFVKTPEENDRLVLIDEGRCAAERRWGFFCPGCQCAHWIGAGWLRTGTPERPTVSPSILTGHIPGSEGGRCHSFIRDGQIQYLADCDHDLAGKTVDLPPFLPPFWKDESDEASKDVTWIRKTLEHGTVKSLGDTEFLVEWDNPTMSPEWFSLRDVSDDFIPSVVCGARLVYGNGIQQRESGHRYHLSWFQDWEVPK